MCTIFTMYSSFMERVNAPAATWLLSLMFALSEAEHKSENKSKIDLGELRDCLHLREEVWDTPCVSLQPCTFLLSVSHGGFDASSIPSFSLNSNLANLLLQFVPISSSFLEIWSFHRLCTHSQPQEEPAETPSLLWEFCTSAAHGAELEIPCVPHQKSHF